MTDTQPHVQHRALCPVCGRLAAQETTWTNNGITEAAYLCPGPERHSWTSKWYQPKGATV